MQSATTLFRFIVVIPRPLGFLAAALQLGLLLEPAVELDILIEHLQIFLAEQNLEVTQRRGLRPRLGRKPRLHEQQHRQRRGHGHAAGRHEGPTPTRLRRRELLERPMARAREPRTRRRVEARHTVVEQLLRALLEPVAYQLFLTHPSAPRHVLSTTRAACARRASSGSLRCLPCTSWPPPSAIRRDPRS